MSEPNVSTEKPLAKVIYSKRMVRRIARTIINARKASTSAAHHILDALTFDPKMDKFVQRELRAYKAFKGKV